MRFKILVPMVGICAVSFLSNSAMAGLWAKNCATEQSQLCLDATAASNGKVQVSECNENMKAQEWEQNSPWMKYLQNAYEGFGKPCLDMSSETSVVTNGCDSGKDAQKWEFVGNGQVGRIQNLFWNNGGQCLVVGSDGKTVTAAKCNGEKSQDWYWVNVGDPKPCPIRAKEDSKMKLPTTVEEDSKMKLPTTVEEDSKMKLPTTVEKE